MCETYDVVPCREVGLVLRFAPSPTSQFLSIFCMNFDCDDAGGWTASFMCLRYLSGRVFVLDLMPGSQAEVDKFICRGDVIDEINGTSLRNSKIGQVPSSIIVY